MLCHRMVLPSRFGAMEDEEHFVPDYEEETADHSMLGSLGLVVASRRRSGCIACSDRGSVFRHLKTHIFFIMCVWGHTGFCILSLPVGCAAHMRSHST